MEAHPSVQLGLGQRLEHYRQHYLHFISELLYEHYVTVNFLLLGKVQNKLMLLRIIYYKL